MNVLRGNAGTWKIWNISAVGKVAVDKGQEIRRWIDEATCLKDVTATISIWWKAHSIVIHDHSIEVSFCFVGLCFLFLCP